MSATASSFRLTLLLEIGGVRRGSGADITGSMHDTVTYSRRLKSVCASVVAQTAMGSVFYGWPIARQTRYSLETARASLLKLLHAAVLNFFVGYSRRKPRWFFSYASHRVIEHNPCPNRYSVPTAFAAFPAHRRWMTPHYSPPAALWAPICIASTPLPACLSAWTPANPARTSLLSWP